MVQNKIPSESLIVFTDRTAGTAVYAYCIMANNISGATTTTNLSFTVDGQYLGGFFHNPGPNADYNYNVLVFSNNTLSDGQHNFVLASDGPTTSLVLFDYLIYTWGHFR
jgi:hypothetical protein